MLTPASCRLFVIPARDVPVAVILRRGPSKWYHVVRWHMDCDTFEFGAWFHGRIYEERCDLSPDGELLVYFCHGGAYRPGYTDSWTAVSRAPWLHALALWPWGTTYGGGGRFVDNRRLVLHCAYTTYTALPLTHPDHPAGGLEVLPESAEYHQSMGEVQGADWSGRDYRGDLVYCQGSKLFRRDADNEDHELADFGDLRPNPQPPPDWAKEPLA